MPLSPAPIWSRTPLSGRLAWLGRFRALVATHEPALAELIEQEVGKTRFEALMADALPLLAACKWLERRAPRLLKPRRVRGTPFWLAGTKLWQTHEPLGRVGIIATWNYPVQLLGIQLIQALVAGNDVVVKPSERSPRTHARLLALAVQAGLPDGTLSWTDATREAGEALLARTDLDHVVFTGSTEVGRTIARTLAERLVPATLELSGRDSAIVLDDADPKKSAAAIWAAVVTNAGQTCMGPRRALVHQTVYPAFVAALSKLAAKARPRTIIDEPSAQRCFEQVAQAINAGGRDAAWGGGSAPGSPAPNGGPVPPHGRLWRPTAVIDCPTDAALVQGAHFGPAIAVVKVASLDEALDLHDRAGQFLSTAVFTRDPARARALAARLGSTMVTINDVILPTAHPAASIGGRGPSGVGVSRGHFGLLAMTRPVFVASGKYGVRLAGQAPSPMVARLMARFMRRWYGGTNAAALRSASDTLAPAEAAHAGPGAAAPAGATP